MRDTLRRHDRRRPGPAEGQDRPHRPLRLLRRLRHRHHDRRARDDPARARRRRRARQPASAPPSACSLEPACRRRPERSRHEGPRRGEDRRAGRAAAAGRRPRRRARHGLGGRRARAAHRRVRRHPDPLGHEADRRPARAGRPTCKAVGRAGVGVDNVDVEAATKRGIIVANAPQSNVITAAEHTMALLLALARRVPQAHGLADRRRLGALEVQRRRGLREDARDLGFGRIGQLVAQRALGFGMRVVAFDAYVAEERFREAGRRARRDLRRAVRAGGLHHDPPARHRRDRELAQRRGVREDEGRRARDQRRPRRPAGRRPTSRTRSTPARSPAPRSTSSARSRSPSTRCSAIPTSSSRRTSAPRPPRPPTAPATRPPSRCVAALTGGVVTSAVNVPAVAAEDLEALGPFLPLAHDLGRIATALRRGSSVDALEVEYLGRIAERDTRLLTVQVLKGVLEGRTEEEVNDVNAPALAEERGIAVSETSTLAGARLHRPRARDRRQRRRAHARRRHDAQPAATARTCSRPGARASTSSSSRTWRSSATRTGRA